MGSYLKHQKQIMKNINPAIIRFSSRVLIKSVTSHFLVSRSDFDCWLTNRPIRLANPTFETFAAAIEFNNVIIILTEICNYW